MANVANLEDKLLDLRGYPEVFSNFIHTISE